MSVNVERLGRLAAMLEDYAAAPGPIEFDLDGWSKVETRRGGLLWLQKVECGTAACAVGLACLSGTFQQEGLSFYRPKGCGIEPTFAGQSGWEAVESFFELSEEQADRLFSDDQYEISRGPLGAAAVARRIRQMIKRSESGKHRKAKRKTSAAVEAIKAAALAPAPEKVSEHQS